MTISDSSPADARRSLEVARLCAKAGDVAAAQAALRQALDLAAHITPADTRAAVLLDLGRIALQIRDADIAEQAYVRVVRSTNIAEEAQLAAGVELGLVYRITDRHQEAVEVLTPAVERARRLGPPDLLMVALHGLGACHGEVGDHDAAALALDEAAALAEVAGDADRLATLHGELYTCRSRLGEPDIARRHQERHVELISDRVKNLELGIAVGTLGIAHHACGDHRSALDQLHRALKLFAALPDAGQALAITDGNIETVVHAIGHEFPVKVSSAILRHTGLPLPEGEDPGKADLSHDIPCALIALASRHPTLIESIRAIDRIPAILPQAEILALVGDAVRTLSDPDAEDPTDLHQAARFVTQLARAADARDRLEALRRGDIEPDLSGSGHGRFMLYLRSFIGDPHMPVFDAGPWGDVDLEELLAARAAAGPYPLVALGNPEIDAGGAGKIQTQDDTWQEDLDLLGKHADFVIVVPCPTEGTSWEIEWVVTRKLLKKTVFVMPPSSGEHQAWWAEQWSALREQSRLLGLAFPGHDAAGSFFALSAEGHISTSGFDQVLSGTELWSTILEDGPLGAFMPSTEWLRGIQDVLGSPSFFHRALGDDVDDEETTSAKVESHMDRIEGRLCGMSPDMPEKVSAPMLGMLEGGLPPSGAYEDWPPDPAGPIGPRPGLYTVWQNGIRLVWVGATGDLRATLAAHAEGRRGTDGLAEAYLEHEVIPGLDDALRADLASGDLDEDRLLRFRMRRDLGYRVLPMDLEQARFAAEAIARGALDAGVPALLET